MKAMLGLKLFIFFVLCLGLFTGCGFFSPKEAVLWTDKPEFAFYAERFNVAHPGRHIIVEYKPSPAQAYLEEARGPDLITAEELPSRLLSGTMSSVKKLFEKEGLMEDAFYPSLMNLCRFNNDLVLLPVRFNLPAVLLRKDIQAQGTESFFIDPEMLTVRDNNSSSYMSFSPFWNRNFLLYFVLSKGADFREAPNGRLAWNDAELKKGVRILKDWNEALNEKNNAERTFTEKYMNEPGYMLLNKVRISYYFSDVTDYFGIPRDKREALDFRCFGENDTVLMMDNALFIGIPKKSRSKYTARLFLSWFFDTETQRTLSEVTQSRRIRTFGLVHGLSAEKDVTEKHLTRQYPALAGRIPTSDFLKTPGPLPADWKKLKTEVILPWLWAEATGTATVPLEGLLSAWYQ